MSSSICSSLKKPLCLVGMMGCGKSSVGKILAHRLHVSFYDSDQEIEQESGKSISQIFEERGEKEFRNLERLTILKILDQSPGVLSIGGGAFIQEALRLILLERADCIYLKTGADTIYQRIKEATHRPLLQTPDPLSTLNQLLQSREKFYLLSPKIIQTDGLSLEAVVESILGVS